MGYSFLREIYTPYYERKIISRFPLISIYFIKSLERITKALLFFLYNASDKKWCYFYIKSTILK